MSPFVVCRNSHRLMQHRRSKRTLGIKEERQGAFADQNFFCGKNNKNFLIELLAEYLWFDYVLIKYVRCNQGKSLHIISVY
jgi:hypothetical protein